MLVSRLSRSPVGGRAVIGLCTSALLALAGSAFAGGTPGAQTPDPVLRELANQTMGLTDSRIIDMPADLSPAARFQTTVELYDGVYTLDLRPYSMRSENYQIFASDAEGNLTPVEPGPVTTMRGTVAEDPDALVAASITDQGFFARIMLSDGRQFWIEPLGAHLEEGAGRHVLYQNKDVIEPGGMCGTDALAEDVVLFDPVMHIPPGSITSLLWYRTWRPAPSSRCAPSGSIQNGGRRRA